jgi:hypothetical protein
MQNKNKQRTRSIAMLRRVIEDTTEVTIISIFLAMVWMWAGALAPVLGV